MSVAAALSAVPLAGAAPSLPAKSQRPDLPALNLPSPTRGAAAIKALGARLPAVAAHHRMSAERLSQLLREDRSAWLDRRGKLFYVEEFIATGTDSPAPAAAAGMDLGQTFLLHSRPGAARVIYLDFNGHSASNTAWSSSLITAQPYDIDGNPGSFSDTEKQRIQEIWQRVAEDYAPFNVDVTTEAPAPDRLRRTSLSDSLFGTRVVITRNTFYNCSCGGVAYVGTFDHYSATNPNYYQPAWVFTNSTGTGAKSIAEAAAHEAGHNLGLAHDGTTSSGYYSGHGSGATGWAPLMGIGYYREVTQWSRGEYTSANNTQDDLAIIPANGVALLGDDAGNIFASATTLAGSSASVNQPGLIHSRSDVDVYSLVTSGGRAALSIAPAPLGPNLDIAANLYDAAGTLVASSSPAESLSAAFDLALPAGTYYLSIGGTGKGDPASGYSDYGSLGQYRVSGSYASGTVGSSAQAPVAMVSATPLAGTAPLTVRLTGSGSVDADGSLSAYHWDVGDGSSASGANLQHTYSSPGQYTATLRVTDSQGLTDTASVNISVASAAPALRVAGIGVSVSKRYSFYQCTARVTVTSASGAAVIGARVGGAWSGSTSGSTSATTGTGGIATLKAGWTSRRGTCTFTVNGVTLSGHSYAPALNAESLDSVSY